KEGAFLGKRTEDGDRDTKHPEEKRWREEERARELAESKRVFYVALTRAQERLVLACLPLEKESDPEGTYLEEDWRGWVDHCGLRPAEAPWARDRTAATPAVRPPT